jgi:hypothetical protein
MICLRGGGWRRSSRHRKECNVNKPHGSIESDQSESAYRRGKAGREEDAGATGRKEGRRLGERGNTMSQPCVDGMMERVMEVIMVKRIRA